MATRARPPWWRGVYWPAVVVAAVPVWAGAALAVWHAAGVPHGRDALGGRSGALRAEGGASPPRDGNAERPVPVPPPAADPPRPHLLAPFVANYYDPPAAAEPDDAPGRVFRRALARPRPPSLLPAEIAGRPTLGTRIGWYPNPAAALARARETGTLALIVHVAGDADSAEWFAGNNPYAWRAHVFADAAIGPFVHDRFPAAVQKVVTRTAPFAPRPGGNTAAYFCTPDGHVVHVVPGQATAAAFRAEARWAAEVYEIAACAADGDEGMFRRRIEWAHFDRLKMHYRVTLPADAVGPGGAALKLPAVRALPDVARAHALLAADPLPSFFTFAPLVWSRLLVADAPPR